MSYQLILRPDAEADIEDSFAWYEKEQAGLGVEFVFEVQDSFLETILQRPLICQVVFGRTRRFIVNRFPHSIFYLVDKDKIVVTACIHQSRSPRVWRSRK